MVDEARAHPVLPLVTGMSQNAFVSADSYAGFVLWAVPAGGGGDFFQQLQVSQLLIERSWNAALCPAMYLFCARAEQPARTCAMLSATFPHSESLHMMSSAGEVWVLRADYSLVGTCCSYISTIPAMVWAGASRHSFIQAKQPS